MGHIRLPVTILGFLLLALAAFAHAAPTDGVVVARIPWTTGQATYSATVTRESRGGISIGRVVFRRQGEEAPLPGVAYETMDTFVAAMPLAPPERGHLLTLWEGASSLRVVVFTPRVDGMAVVMDARSAGLPELADLDGDGFAEILTTEVGAGGAPERGETPDETVKVGIYRWSGDRYHLSRSVPWERRLGRE